MNFKTISRNTGAALLVSALFMLLSVVVSLLNGRDSAFSPLLISFIITFIVGIFPFIFVRRAPAVTMKEGYMIIVLSWLLSFIVGMLPYALWGEPFTLANAWFESVSGYTTTGSSILEDVEILPKSLLFWRSSTHFIGGLGVVVFLLLVIPEASPMRLRLSNMELSSLSRDSYASRSNKVVRIFAWVYLGLVVVSFVSYMLAGMSPFDAINHAFSVSATGGFSTRTESIGAFHSKLIEGLTMVFMLISSLHFGLVYFSFVTRSVRPLNNPVVKFYLGCLVFFSLFLALNLRIQGFQQSFGESLWDSAFHVLCVATTTGFATMDNSTWPASANLVLLFMGTMCACAGSTSGGIKADRMLILFKSVRLQVRRAISPSTVAEVRIGKRYLRDEEVAPHIVYIALYAFFVVSSQAIAVLMNMDPMEAFGASVASLGNVGPALGSIGTAGSYAAVPAGAKFLFTVDMFLGRVEIYPVLAVLYMTFSGRRK